MKVRAKFTVTKVAVLGYGGKQLNITAPDPANVPGGVQNYVDTGVPMREIHTDALYDPNKNPEDIGFAAATPSGSITFQLDNPDLAEAFKPGQTYYVDFTPAE